MASVVVRLIACLGMLVVFLGADDPEGGENAVKNDPALENAIAPLIEKHEGDVAVAIVQLDGPARYYHRADAVMPTASLIKFPVLLTVWKEHAAGNIDFDKTVTLDEEDKVPGSGILTENFSDGATFPLRDAIRLMIVFSDNTATNLVVDEIGVPATSRYMKTLGATETRLNAKVYRGDETSIDPERTDKYGLGSTTAREMISLLIRFERGELAEEKATTAMRELLLDCKSDSKIARYLPNKVNFAHKTGGVSDARCDAGLLYFPETTVAICVLTNENEDKSWGDHNDAELLCAEIGKVVVERFLEEAKGEKVE